jgi:acyl-CoA synthetase (AMP-forming)/AMP-acid ligase II
VPEVLVGHLAVLVAGRVAVPLNPRWSAAELANALAIAAPALLLLHHNVGAAPSAAALPAPLRGVPRIALDARTLRPHGQHVANAAAEDEARRSGHGDTGSSAYSAAPIALPLRAPPCGTAYVCFTSGTSAAAKGVAVEHGALHAQSLVKLAVVGYDEGDVYLHSSPLFHIGAHRCRVQVACFAFRK